MPTREEVFGRVRIPMCVAVLVLALPAGTAAGGIPEPSPLILHLDGSTRLQVAKGAAKSEEQLARDWGQFEVFLPQKAFPLPAPHCKGQIRLRFIGVKPSAPGRDEVLKARWSLLQSLRDLAEGKGPALELVLDAQHYIVRDAGGPHLQYCNAFSQGALK